METWKKIMIGVMFGMVTIAIANIVSAAQINFLLTQKGIAPVISNTIFGEVWKDTDNITEIIFEEQDTFYNLTFDDSIMKNLYFNDTEDYIEIIIPGEYLVVYSASLSGENNHIYATTVIVNGEEQERCMSYKKMPAGGDVTTISGNCLIPLNQYGIISLAVKDYEGTGTGNYWAGTMDILRIGSVYVL